MDASVKIPGSIHVCLNKINVSRKLGTYQCEAALLSIQFKSSAYVSVYKDNLSIGPCARPLMLSFKQTVVVVISLVYYIYAVCFRIKEYEEIVLEHFHL